MLQAQNWLEMLVLYYFSGEPGESPETPNGFELPSDFIEMDSAPDYDGYLLDRYVETAGYSNKVDSNSYLPSDDENSRESEDRGSIWVEYEERQRSKKKKPILKRAH